MVFQHFAVSWVYDFFPKENTGNTGTAGKMNILACNLNYN